MQSQLGGEAEGVVLKHHRYQHVRYRGQWRDGVLDEKQAVTEIVDKKLKFVSEQFKESKTAKRDKAAELTPTTFLRWIGRQYCTVARWRKGVQRLRDKQDVTWNSQWSEVQQAVYVERLYKELDVDLLKEYETVIRSYIDVEFHEFVKVHQRAARQSMATAGQQVSQELQSDVIFQQLAVEGWEQHMEEYLQVVCESAREGLDVHALVHETDCDGTAEQ